MLPLPPPPNKQVVLLLILCAIFSASFSLFYLKRFIPQVTLPLEFR